MFILIFTSFSTAYILTDNTCYKPIGDLSVEVSRVQYALEISFASLLCDQTSKWLKIRTKVTFLVKRVVLLKVKI